MTFNSKELFLLNYTFFYVSSGFLKKIRSQSLEFTSLFIIFMSKSILNRLSSSLSHFLNPIPPEFQSEVLGQSFFSSLEELFTLESNPLRQFQIAFKLLEDLSSPHLNSETLSLYLNALGVGLSPSFEKLPIPQHSLIDRAHAESQLQQFLQSRRRYLFDLWLELPNGLFFLIQLRQKVLSFLPQEPWLAPLEFDLFQTLRTATSFSNLHVQHITAHSSATLLESIFTLLSPSVSYFDFLSQIKQSHRVYFVLTPPNDPDHPLVLLEALLTSRFFTPSLNLDFTALYSSNPTVATLQPPQFFSSGLHGIHHFLYPLITHSLHSLRRSFPSLQSFYSIAQLPLLFSYLSGLSDSKLEALVQSDLRFKFLSHPPLSDCRSYFINPSFPSGIRPLDPSSPPEHSWCDPFLKILTSDYLKSPLNQDPLLQFYASTQSTIETIAPFSTASSHALPSLFTQVLYRHPHCLPQWPPLFH